MNPKEKKGLLIIIGVFILLAVVLVFSIDKPSTSNTFKNNPLVNKMPNRVNP